MGMELRDYIETAIRGGCRSDHAWRCYRRYAKNRFVAEILTQIQAYIPRREAPGPDRRIFFSSLISLPNEFRLDKAVLMPAIVAAMLSEEVRTMLLNRGTEGGCCQYKKGEVASARENERPWVYSSETRHVQNHTIR